MAGSAFDAYVLTISLLSGDLCNKSIRSILSVSLSDDRPLIFNRTIIAILYILPQYNIKLFLSEKKI